MVHYSTHNAERVEPCIHPPFRYAYLYRSICICGFSCEAYGKVLTNNQMAGHIKTMEWLEEQHRLKG